MAQLDTPLTRALAQCDRLTEALRREQARNVELTIKAQVDAGLEQAYALLLADHTSLQATTRERPRRRARSWLTRVRRRLYFFFCWLAELFEAKG